MSDQATGDTIKITRVSPCAFQYERSGVTKALNVTSINATTFTVTTADGDVYNWNSTTRRLVKADNSEQWAPAFSVEITAVPIRVHTIAPYMAGDRFWYLKTVKPNDTRHHLVSRRSGMESSDNAASGRDASSHYPLARTVSYTHLTLPTKRIV